MTFKEDRFVIEFGMPTEADVSDCCRSTITRWIADDGQTHHPAYQSSGPREAFGASKTESLSREARWQDDDNQLHLIAACASDAEIHVRRTVEIGFRRKALLFAVTQSSS